MLSVLPTFIGVQFLIAFLNFDVNSTPRDAMYPVFSSLPRDNSSGTPGKTELP
jgi:hypothetical protein